MNAISIALSDCRSGRSTSFARNGNAASSKTICRASDFPKLPLMMVRSALLAGFLAFPIPNAAAQTANSDIAGLTLRLSSWTGVTGYEQALGDSLLRLIPQARRDRVGNVRLHLGGGSPKRLVACPLDEPGYVVGGVRPDGYLTLRRVPGQVSPLFDQQIEGQRITIQAIRGEVPGVVAVRSIHLTRGRDDPSSTPFTVDNAFVDVGASSAPQVRALGIKVLSPVTLAKRPHAYGTGLVAAPSAGRRAACAALLLAARQSVLRAKLLPPVTIAFTVQQRLENRGLATIANAEGPFNETMIVDAVAGRLGSVDLRGTSDSTLQADSTGSWRGLGSVRRWSLPVRYQGTPVETVSTADADSLRQALVKWIGGEE
jgi:putative aminopeptidase